LKAGKPTIIHPFFGDQYFWADRIVKLNLGIRVKNFKINEISKALEDVFSDKFVANCKNVAELIGAEDGVGAAVEAVYYELARMKRGGYLDAYDGGVIGVDEVNKPENEELIDNLLWESNGTIFKS
jgi:sterol 3beta-glucosyltransferase